MNFHVNSSATQKKESQGIHTIYKKK